MQQVFEGFDVTLTDAADGARPGLHLPAAKAFVDGARRAGRAQGGLDRRRALLGAGHPGGQLRPGDPNLAHMDDERCPVQQYVDAEAALLRWLAV